LILGTFNTNFAGADRRRRLVGRFDVNTAAWRDRGAPDQLVQMAVAVLRLSQRRRLSELGR
jgi:hypothetical protein